MGFSHRILTGCLLSRYSVRIMEISVVYLEHCILGNDYRSSIPRSRQTFEQAMSGLQQSSHGFPLEAFAWGITFNQTHKQSDVDTGPHFVHSRYVELISGPGLCSVEFDAPGVIISPCAIVVESQHMCKEGP